MSSEHLASAQTELKGDLGASWNILDGASANYTDLGISRRFGGAAAAYSLRDIGAMNGRVVKVRRDVDGQGSDPEEDFSANQVQSGALEDWVNGKLESTLPADVNYVVGLESARYFNGTNSGVVTSSISGLVNATGSIETSFALFEKNSVIVSFEDNSDSNDNLTIQTDASGFLTLLHRTDGSTNILAKLQSLVLDDGTLHTIRWNMSSSGSQVILDGKDITSEMTFTTGNSSTVKWVSDLNDPDVLSIGYRAEVSPDGFATGVVVNTTIFGTDNTTPLANYLGYGSSNYWNDTIGSLNATESNITQTWEQAQGAAAAYSLRKVKASYSGDAVRIRRSSDDVEVDVAFDSDDKVSASSAITNVAEQGGESGSTTATDLNGFLNETLTVGTAVNGTGSFPYDRFTANGNTGFDADNKGGGISSAGFPYAFANGDVFVIRYTVSNFDNESGLSPGFRGTTGTSTVTQVAGGGTTFTANGTYTDTLTATADGTHIMCADGNTGSYTISNFEVLSHTHSAFVHTWYDQAGSNDATQTTAANQPQIAENGALLTKRGQTTLKFRGTDSVPISLGASASITASHSVFIVGQPSPDGATALDGNDVANNTFWSGGNSGVSLHIAGINSAFSEGYRNSGDASRIFSYTATQEFHTSVNLHTAINGSSNFSYYANTVSKISDLNGAGTDTAITIGKKTGIDSHNTRGFISELIQYNSDQTDNRFKIESNINNYYGLYNDENEASDVFQGVNYTVTDATKTGFTIDIVTATGVGTLPLVDGPDANETIYVSYNLTINSGSPSINVVTQDRSGATNTTSADFIITEAGFYAHAITPTQDGATHLSFADDADNVNFTISDLKISRIARNGFVETWYDQSGNGNNATQASASQQPTIISNGNQVTLDNGTPSVAFSRRSGFGSVSNLSISTPIANEPYTFFATTVHNSSSTWFRLFGESNAPPTVLLRSNNTIEFDPSDSDASGAISATTTSDNIVSGFSGVNGGDDGILRFNGANIKTDISRTEDGDSISLIGRFPNDGTNFAHIESLVIYESDLSADFDTIEKELAQPINIL